MKIHLKLAFTILMLLLCNSAFSGIDVSLEEEVEKIQRMDRQVPSDNPRYNQLRRLKKELDLLLEMPEDQRSGEESRIFNLQRKVHDLNQVLEKEIRDFNDDSPQPFSGAKNRVVVFTYDDPHQSGIGDALSFIVSKALLFSAPVRSYAVVNYQGGAETPDDGGLTYFDKVAKITSIDKFVFSVWGKITETGDRLVIDTFGQIDNNLDPYLHEQLIPSSMGGGYLQARVNSNRFKIHSFSIPSSAVDEFLTVSENIRTLRAGPTAESAVVGPLPERKKYVIVEGQGNWIKLDFDGGESGWTNVKEYCTDECISLLSPVKFVNDFIALASADRHFDIKPDIHHGAITATRQLNAIKSLKKDPSVAQEIARDEPAEAGFASISALATIAMELKKESLEQDFNEIRLDSSLIGRVADELANASLLTPKDLDILYNLAILFNYLGDEKRRDIAFSIAESIESKTN